MKTKCSNLLCIGILALGSTAMLGEICGIKQLKSIGLATCAAPYTKVFCSAKCAANGLEFESFAAEFSIRYKRSGEWNELEITPEIYQNLEGSYNRRNVYGAVIAYGPALPEVVSKKTLKYAMTDPGYVSRELGLPEQVEDYEVVIRSKTKGSDKQWILKGE